MHQFWIFSTILKSPWDLFYSEQNCDVREVFRNLIGCLEGWELENTDKSRIIKTPDWCIFTILLSLEKKRESESN